MFQSQLTLWDMHFPMLPSCKDSDGMLWLCAEDSVSALPLGSPMAPLCLCSDRLTSELLPLLTP